LGAYTCVAGTLGGGSLTCTAVACPTNSAGTNVGSGCICATGYTGTITATATAPYYSGSCTASYCLINEYVDALGVCQPCPEGTEAVAPLIVGGNTTCTTKQVRCTSTVANNAGNLSFTLTHRCLNAPQASRALYGAMDNAAPRDNATTRDICIMSQSASTAIAAISPAGYDMIWTFLIHPQTECGCTQVLNATHITKTCFTYIYLDSSILYQRMGSNVTVVWTAGYTALVGAQVSIAPDAQVQSDTAGLEATLNLYTNDKYDTNRLASSYAPITDGEFLYYAVSVPNAPVNGDLKVDLVQMCNTATLDTASSCIQLLNIDEKVVDNQKPSLTTTGVAIVGFPFPITGFWTVFVSGFIRAPTGAPVTSSPTTFGTLTGTATNQGRRLLQDAGSADSSFSASATVELNILPATSSEMAVSMGFREGASALPLLFLAALYM